MFPLAQASWNPNTTLAESKTGAMVVVVVVVEGLTVVEVVVVGGCVVVGSVEVESPPPCESPPPQPVNTTATASHAVNSRPIGASQRVIPT
jgi:hypothetical protein